MYVLGIVGGTRQGYQDCSATLLKNGEVVAAVEEERLIRVKHAPGILPEKAIHEVLNIRGISLKDVDVVASHGITWSPDFRLVLRDFLSSKFGCCPPVELVHHHDAHCASAYYASGFQDAMILSADFSGDGISTQIAVGVGGSIRNLERYERPDSLGAFYSILTEFCGFMKDNDEYIFMGLSSYGNRRAHDFSWLVEYGNGRYQVNARYLKGFKPGEPGPSKQVPLYNEEFTKKMGPPRPPGAPMTSYYADIAASGQRHLEEILVHLVTKLHEKTGLHSLCLAGGVALNAVANQRLMNLEFVDDIYIQPAANDAGVSLGAAYLVATSAGERVRPMGSVYLGRQFSNDEILEALQLSGVSYETVINPASLAAKEVASGKTVGWFQGRMEFGPRALGNRSILADPTNGTTKDLINRRIKCREQFRPFCPSVLEEDSPQLFLGKKASAPYMTVTYDAASGCAAKLPSVVHVDNTARIQTVNRAHNELYYEFLQELKHQIGYGVVLNTSFNAKGEPIVNRPVNALGMFYGSGMDTLIMGNYVVRKAHACQGK